MYTSATIATTSGEIRPTRYVGPRDEQRTIRVRPGRATSRRRAIRESLASVR